MEKTPMMKMIDKLNLHIENHKRYTGRFDTGAMIARNYALSLLEEESSMICFCEKMSNYEKKIEYEER
jgi:hypothetical protein